jgi:acetaldehyde dehydrogenase (acetylating)
MEGTNALMRHPRTGVILSTGGSGIVRAAYSSGKPAFGVGPGNVPVLIEESADVPEAIGKVIDGKSFDYGTVCSSEQTIVAPASLRDSILSELKTRKAFLCTPEQGKALARILFDDKLIVRAECVGQSPQKIAGMAGFDVPADTTILAVEIAGVGKQHPLSAEKLSPVLAVYFVPDFSAAMSACEGILRFGGLGHTCVIYSKDDARILEYGRRMPAFRVLVNTPSPQGSTGITTNVMPSMTLGCGAMAGNITSDNVGPQHLFNIKRIAYAVRKPEEAFPMPPPSPSKPEVRSAVIGNVDKQVIVSAVERFLSNKGFSVAPAPAPPPKADSKAIATLVVDRFLGVRAEPASKPVESRCGSCALPAPAKQAEPVAAAAPLPKPAEPAITITDFVCESDVRVAMRQSSKIYIGPKTIVTPSARDLAGQHDILVMAKRS